MYPDLVFEKKDKTVGIFHNVFPYILKKVKKTHLDFLKKSCKGVSFKSQQSHLFPVLQALRRLKPKVAPLSELVGGTDYSLGERSANSFLEINYFPK